MSTTSTFKDRNYWIAENALYTAPSFRLRKCARLVNELAGNRSCTLLDVGCGPAALRLLLNPNINYYGIDIAIHEPAKNLKELDIAHAPITFEDRQFDFVTALGFFEYMGNEQERKFEEIRAILKDTGKFIMSYINFGHLHKAIWPNYNNVRSIAEMKASLGKAFQIECCFPASYHWRQKQPGKRALAFLQMYLDWNIPILSPLLAVEYFFVCSHKH